MHDELAVVRNLAARLSRVEGASRVAVAEVEEGESKSTCVFSHCDPVQDCERYVRARFDIQYLQDRQRAHRQKSYDVVEKVVEESDARRQACAVECAIGCLFRFGKKPIPLLAP